MKTIRAILNHPAEAYKCGEFKISILLVLLTVAINAVFEPVLQTVAHGGLSSMNYTRMGIVTLLGIASYIVISIIIWFICMIMGSKRSFIEHLKTWGMTFIPTLVCAIVVAVTETYAHVFWNSMFWGLFFSIVYSGILIWKIILYYVYLREFAGLCKIKLLAAFFIIAFIIFILAGVSGFLGLKTPVM